LSKAGAINNPFEQAFFLMVHLPYLQPFEDVNKRVSRLAANLPLNRQNLVPLSFVGVPQDLYTSGLLAIYELNRIELFRDVFLWSYKCSSNRYAQIRQTLGEPDLFRMKYREQIHQVIREIVSGAMNRKDASAKMQESANAIPNTDRFQFIEAAETELLSLHDGSFARYRISPSQFLAWKLAWN
jgi:Fic/DOC family